MCQNEYLWSKGLSALQKHFAYSADHLKTAQHVQSDTRSTLSDNNLLIRKIYEVAKVWHFRWLESFISHTSIGFWLKQGWLLKYMISCIIKHSGLPWYASLPFLYRQTDAVIPFSRQIFFLMFFFVIQNMSFIYNKPQVFILLPNDAILDWFKFKAFADDKKECNLKTETIIRICRKHCGKRRKCSLPAFSLFPTVFSKGFFFRVIKSPDCVVKS